MSQPTIVLQHPSGDARLWVVEDFLYDEIIESLCDEVFNSGELIHEPDVFVHGQLRKQRRDVLFLSNISDGYKYSGQFMPSKPLKTVPSIQKLLDYVNTYCETSFNGVLINFYRDGSKVVGSHADSAIGLDPNNFMVVGIAFGAERIFRIRDKESNEIVYDHPHTPNSLIVMDGNFQNRYKHEIPPQLKIKDWRLSFTFRTHTK